MKNELKKFTLSFFLKIMLLLLSTAVVFSIALFTRFDAHPDEGMHVNAFQYFEGRFWPPDLGSSEVKYSKYGISRVYSQEVVYIIYGNISCAIQKTTGIDSSYLTYRGLNVLLYFLTLALLLFSKSDIFKPHYIGFVFASIPQISYIYACANSDAWALSLGIFLFIFVLQKHPHSILQWPGKDIFFLGVLLGLILSSKRNYYLTLLLPFFIVFYTEFQNRRAWKCRVTDLIRIFLFLGIPVMFITSPLKIFYPLSQPDYQQKKERIIEEKSVEGFKPSNPWKALRNLSQRGYDYQKMLSEHDWFSMTFKSLWGYYGYMNLSNPGWIYSLALFFGLILTASTGYDFFSANAPPQNMLRICLALSCLVMTLNIYLSLSYSLNIDYQPQGRYLFPSFIPMALCLSGNTFRKSWPLFLRQCVLLCAYLLGLYSLLFVCLANLSKS